MPLLGHTRKHVLVLLLSTEAATAPDVPGREVGDPGNEAERVLALFNQADEPAPRQRNRLGDGVVSALWTPHVAEVDLGVQLNAGQDGEEGGVEVLDGQEAGRAYFRRRTCGTTSMKRPPSGRAAW